MKLIELLRKEYLSSLIEDSNYRIGLLITKYFGSVKDYYNYRYKNRQ